MSKRAGSIRRTNGAGSLPAASEARALAGDLADVESAATIVLPRDHPRWLRDRFTLSAATKMLLDRIAPLAIRVFGFWDHRVHRLTLDDSAIEVDACGSYRLEHSPSRT